MVFELAFHCLGAVLPSACCCHDNVVSAEAELDDFDTDSSEDDEDMTEAQV